MRLLAFDLAAVGVPFAATLQSQAALDRVGGLVALLLLAPLLFGTAIAVRMTSPGTMLFTQVRVCKDGASSHSASSAP